MLFTKLFHFHHSTAFQVLKIYVHFATAVEDITCKKVVSGSRQASLLSFQTVVVFITTKNILDEVKALASKLQKRDQDIFEAYMMVYTKANNCQILVKCSWLV